MKRTLVLFVCLGQLFLTGCQSLNSKFGIDGSDYSDAQERAALKFPPDALPVSSRYDIPKISNIDGPLMYEPMPPDYESSVKG